MMKLFIASAAMFCTLAYASAVNAQEPIVRLDVKPAKPAFGQWDKPLVIRTAEDAGKHFDKDALEVMAKKVDFKKQFVVVFAWRGSGGDKLDYTVAESFPEQIGFSHKAGFTDDLRSHIHVFALRNNVKWSIRSPAKGPKPEGDKPANIRELLFKPADPTAIFTLGGKANVTVLKDAAAVEKLVGKAAKQLVDQVNFEFESIAFVSWNTSGPPDGKLMYETTGTPKNPKHTFYVKGPPGGGARGQRLRIGADFYAVPRDGAVTFDPKER
jgi:hypothetical protein